MSVKILHIYNQREVWGGEDYMVQASVAVLRRHGEEVDLWTVRNRDYLSGLRRKVRAFMSGIYSGAMKREMLRKLEQDKPDVVHAHNLYPILSASVLVACSQAKVPVVVHCHNHFLTCPIGTHLRNGRICEDCASGSVLPCVLNNCRASLPESLAYAMRTAAARWFGWFKNHATLLIVLAEYTRKRLKAFGFADEQLVVLPNVVSLPEMQFDHEHGTYVAYVGRLSHEKGVLQLIEAASALPDIQFRIAGDGPLKAELEGMAPANVRFEGWLNRDEVSELYRGARFAVVPSICYETFGLAAADAMAHGLPVVASRIGGLQEIIDENETGLFFDVDDPRDLVNKITTLWHDRDARSRMGKAAYLKASIEYSEAVYYKRLMEIYRSAIDKQKGNAI